MPKTSEQQKRYQQRWRAKRDKVEGLCKELDQVVASMEKLPRGDSGRKRFWVEAELVRAQLQELAH